MSLWMLLIIVGIVLLVLGIAVPAVKFLLWLGLVVLVVSAVRS
ncbi:MAG: hypothetical protein Q4P36_01935 [Bowdeniella nasicola]|nr:hypothetical protein [Bowdeniella nasicola]